MKVPAHILRQLYTFGTLENQGSCVRFELKNRLVPAKIEAVLGLRLNGRPCALDRVQVTLPDGAQHIASQVAEQRPLDLPVRAIVEIVVQGVHLDEGRHQIALQLRTDTFGELSIEIEDALSLTHPHQARVPHDARDDYSMDHVRERQDFVREFSGVELDHITRFSFDPARTRGNIENFSGVAQVPLGFAGPIEIDGEYAKGEFLVPMATTEGTLVASYNRGIKVLNRSGGVRVTVSEDAMQRAPVFIFESAREARDFRNWIDENLEAIRKAAEATTSHGKLLYVDTYLTNKFAYLRFNFSTGDAAGQNMVGRATFAACRHILDRVDTVQGFFLEANLATDKKHSHINIMRTRGKRVTAEATVPREVLRQNMRVEPEQLHRHASIGTIGAVLSGASNNGAHSSNGITAMFIATGQDVANVSESSAGILFTELTPNGDLYVSLTIPSLIVATHGGGTGLPTQREALSVLGCTEPGSAKKLAEIMGGVALAGELSLGAAISSLDWVSSHERLGRNR